jgi:hypothetical protein
VYASRVRLGAGSGTAELARKNEIASQDELEKFIRAVDQVTSDEELNRLARKEEKRDD